MNNDEALRRLQLVKMFVKNAIEALEPVTDDWFEKEHRSLPYDIDEVTAALEELSHVEERLTVALLVDEPVTDEKCVEE